MIDETVDDLDAASIAERTLTLGVLRLAECLKQCGFDEREYLARNPDLQSAGLDPASALVHFLRHGVRERRDVPVGALPDGLEDLRLLADGDAAYRTLLFRRIYHGQVTNPKTADRLWSEVDARSGACVRAMGGVLYFVIGDSHADHYVRSATAGPNWLAPLPLVCRGAAAATLANGAAQSRYGAQIMRWAATAARLKRALDAPIFLKFGGIDAEVRWMSRRIANGVVGFSMDQYEIFARESVAQYADFIAALSNILDPARLRVCSVFPASVPDSDWADAFLAGIHTGSPDRDRYFVEALPKMEIPDLRVRTELRARYNVHLRAMCDAAGLAYVDDFSVCVDAMGATCPRYVRRHGQRGFHLDYDACEDVMVNVIRAHLDLPAGANQRIASMKPPLSSGSDQRVGGQVLGTS